jgi:hypothetical protein
MTVIGFTGTRDGLTPPQRAALKRLVADIRLSVAVHGAAIGADAEFVLAVSEIIPRPQIVARPSDQPQQTDANALALSDKIHRVEPPLARNHKIVGDADALIACPRLDNEELRSGTWATVRSARKQGKLITILWPDGRVTVEDPVPA